MSTKYVAMQQVKDASLSDMINIENIQATHTDTVFESSSTTTNFILTVPFLESRDFNDSGFIVFTPTISNGSPLAVTVNGQRLTAVNSSGLALNVGTLNANMVCVGKIYSDKFYFLDIGNWGASSSTTNAVPSDVLLGKKFLNMNGLSQTGTMPNNGNADNAIVSGTLRSGYTSGGKITNLLAENVKNGINIGGITGTLTSISDIQGTQENVVALENISSGEFVQKVADILDPSLASNPITVFNYSTALKDRFVVIHPAYSGTRVYLVDIDNNVPSKTLLGTIDTINHSEYSFCKFGDHSFIVFYTGTSSGSTGSFSEESYGWAFVVNMDFTTKTLTTGTSTMVFNDNLLTGLQGVRPFGYELKNNTVVCFGRNTKDDHQYYLTLIKINPTSYGIVASNSYTLLRTYSGGDSFSVIPSGNSFLLAYFSGSNLIPYVKCYNYTNLTLSSSTYEVQAGHGSDSNFFEVNNNIYSIDTYYQSGSAVSPHYFVTMNSYSNIGSSSFKAQTITLTPTVDASHYQMYAFQDNKGQMFLVRKNVDENSHVYFILNKISTSGVVGDDAIYKDQNKILKSSVGNSGIVDSTSKVFNFVPILGYANSYYPYFLNVSEHGIIKYQDQLDGISLYDAVINSETKIITP